MCLLRLALFIKSDKYCVVVVFILIESMLFGKVCDDVSRDKPLFYEVSIHSVHICVCLGQSELFLFFLCDSFRRTVGQRSYPLSQQFLYRSLKVHIIEFLHKFYCTAANLIFMVEPF